ncbi:MAG: DNA photolyase, partial [Planctomycetota bacterium]
MIDLVYIEEAVRDHPRTRAILDRVPAATRISCDHYGEVFNRRAQSFRLQKRQPALILANKEGRLVHETPKSYGIGHERNYYFSHM